MQRLSIIVVVLLLCGCSLAPVRSTVEQPPAPSFESRLFGERPPILSPADIHRLSDEQRLAFLRYFNDPSIQDRPAHQRVFDYLELETSRFGYRGETYTASQALENAAGNCLSLAILTTSLARLANVEIEYQLIDSDPVFESASNHIRRSQHVRSVLYDPAWEAPEGFLVLTRPRIKVDYFPGNFDRFVGNIEVSEYVAMYYQNLAAAALDEQHLGNAYWLLMASLEYAPVSPESLNMLAIVFDRANDKAKSEEIYRFGLAHAERRVSLLRNYGLFLKRQGRLAEAKNLDAQLATLDDPNPFDWIYAAQQAYATGDYERAIDLFERSNEIAPYLHESHFGLAKTYYRLGNESRAREALEQAVFNASRPSTQKLYEAKLAALNMDPDYAR